MIFRGWYSQHFPELHKLIGDDAKLYVTCVTTIGDRKNMPEDIEEQLNLFIKDLPKVKLILEAAHNSMGKCLFYFLSRLFFNH